MKIKTVQNKAIQSYINEIEDELTSICNFPIFLYKMKKISIPRFMGTGGTYHWVVFGNEKKDIYFRGIIHNNNWVSCSVSSTYAIANALPVNEYPNISGIAEIEKVYDSKFKKYIKK